MDERLRFVARLLEGEKMAPLCAEFGIYRKTGICRRSAPSRPSSTGTASSSAAAGGVIALRVPPSAAPPNRTPSGPPITKASSCSATAATATPDDHRLRQPRPPHV